MFSWNIVPYIYIAQSTNIVSTDSFKIKDMKILLHPALKNQIAREFKTSNQNVLTSLSYFNNSPKAQLIRKRTKELLLAEAEKVQIEKFIINEEE